MYTVYVVRSLKNNKRYVGYTSKTALGRLKDHHSGSNQWSRQNGPFKLIHEELFCSEKDARQRERFLKSGQGRKWLDENIPR